MICQAERQIKAQQCENARIISRIKTSGEHRIACSTALYSLRVTDGAGMQEFCSVTAAMNSLL